ncbi:transposase family protein [Umezawaea beigongshangensis]|uniref:transposase family protein n=1 Tax=Umezawaea beigongshangensis TaxID=2780383 RepID=UPI0018F250FC|nr:transposase family protein [Umezawaea beigongshangensis]
MVTCSATLDVPRHVVDLLARLLAAHRRTVGTPSGSRALSPFRQAVLVLRWFRDRDRIHRLAVDAGISQATGYRYLHEGVDVLADQAPELHDVLKREHDRGLTHVVLDGTPVPCARLAGVTQNGNDLWYSGKGHRFAGNIQFISAPDGTPLWVSDVEPGSFHDMRAARLHALPALYKAARGGLPTLADVDHTGAGAGVHTPIRPPDPQGFQLICAIIFPAVRPVNICVKAAGMVSSPWTRWVP